MRIIIVLISLFSFTITILSQEKNIVDEKQYCFGVQVNGGLSKLLISDLYFADLSGDFFDEKSGRYGQVMFFVSRRFKRNLNIGISIGLGEFSNLTYLKNSYNPIINRFTINRNYYLPIGIVLSKKIKRFDFDFNLGTAYFLSRTKIINDSIKSQEVMPSSDGYKTRMFMTYIGVDIFFEIIKLSHSSLSLGYSSSISVNPRFWVNSIGLRLKIK